MNYNDIILEEGVDHIEEEKALYDDGNQFEMDFDEMPTVGAVWESCMQPSIVQVCHYMLNYVLCNLIFRILSQSCKFLQRPPILTTICARCAIDADVGFAMGLSFSRASLLLLLLFAILQFMCRAAFSMHRPSFADSRSNTLHWASVRSTAWHSPS